MSAGSHDSVTAGRTSSPRRDAAIGGVGGLAGGLLGVGGGFVLVPLQVIWARRDQHRAIGTSLTAILPIALVAAADPRIADEVDHVEDRFLDTGEREDA